MPDQARGGAEPRARWRPRRLLRAIAWDLKLQLRYQIVTVAALVTIFYVAAFKGLGLRDADKLLTVLIYSDPSTLGFFFVGVLVLFEKGANTLQALVVTPLSPGEYLWSKALSLTLLALVSGFAMAIAGHGWSFNYLALFLAICLSSLLFVFIGFVGVARVHSLNEYLIVVPAFLGPVSLPFLNFMGITDTYAFYVIPSQASLILFEAAFSHPPAWQITYAISFLGVSLIAAFFWARSSFNTHIRNPGRTR